MGIRRFWQYVQDRGGVNDPYRDLATVLNQSDLLAGADRRWYR